MKNAWHRFQRYYFSYNRSDRNAVIIIAGILLIVLIAKALLPVLIPEQRSDFSEMKALIKKWDDKKPVQQNNSELHLFFFDPNTIAQSEIDSLDLPEFVKQNILRYREAGGSFSSAKDLRKIYGMSDSVFHIIQPFIQIERQIPVRDAQITAASHRSFKIKSDSLKQDFVEKEVRNSVQSDIIELNEADSATLVALPGIGPVFAKRIVKYRNLLGGFYKKEQLLEVYNFPSETYSKISEYLLVDTLEIQKLRINFFDFPELLRHPYLSKEQVSAIINQREKHGPFRNLSDVAKIKVFDCESFDRIRPYLSCR